MGKTGCKENTTVYIRVDQDQKLKELKRVTGVPVAEYIRQGIDMVLEREEKKEDALRRLDQGAAEGGPRQHRSDGEGFGGQ